jgi:hypothetical protein
MCLMSAYQSHLELAWQLEFVPGVVDVRICIGMRTYAYTHPTKRVDNLPE